jgi:hypothetical protein
MDTTDFQRMCLTGYVLWNKKYLLAAQEADGLISHDYVVPDGRLYRGFGVQLSPLSFMSVSAKNDHA